MSDLKTRWFATTSHFLTDGTAEIVWNLLDDCYSESIRGYHNWNHIADCFIQFDEAAHLANNRTQLELALFYHDVIYDPKGSGNEEASAEFAAETLSRAGFPDSEIAIVHQLILDTKHQVEPKSFDGRLLVDVDLSILGADPARFDQYETDIRQEYRWVELQAYRAGRAQIMQGFLIRPQIYFTDYFREKFEAQARDNLASLIAKLSAD
ncbi:MAG: N-methyl-D-aspartate receptor NMDAR2C subunit [Chloroflexota bacterium]